MPHPERASDPLARSDRRPEDAESAFARSFRFRPRSSDRRDRPRPIRSASRLSLAQPRPQRRRIQPNRRAAWSRAVDRRAGHVRLDVERALRLQALAAALPAAADRGRHASCKDRARTPARSISATAWRPSSRSNRTTTRAPSSRTRARRRASAASCATSSRWARARSRFSIRSASARSTQTRNRYLFDERRRRHRRLRQLPRHPECRRRGLLRRVVQRQSARQRDVRRRGRDLAADAGASLGRRATSS